MLEITEVRGWGSLYRVYLWGWEGRYPVQEESSITFHKEDRQPLEEVGNGYTLLLTCLPGLG